MSVSFDAEGTITIGLAGGPVVLARPTLGQYRTLRDQYRQAHKRMQANSKRADHLAENPDDYTEEEAEALLDELVDDLETWHHGFIAAAATLLADKPLPESADDWPADLALDPTIPGRMLDHWRRVPLAHGSNPTS